jgi:hypothetical protein
VTFFCLLSLLLSFSVVASLLSRRSQTSSSRLILLLNLSISLGTFSKFPFLYSGLACEFSGFVVNYCACQILIITYYQLNARNITHLISNTEIDNPADCQLSTKSLLIIALVPIIFGTFPITLFQYHRHGPWCELHASSASSSSVVLLTGYVLLWILELSLLYELFKLIRKIWKVPSDIFYLTIRRFLLGPALCATYTLAIFFCLDLVTIVTTLSHPSPIGNYYGDYTFTMLQYYLEKNNLDVGAPSSFFILPGTSLLPLSLSGTGSLFQRTSRV